MAAHLSYRVTTGGPLGSRGGPVSLNGGHDGFHVTTCPQEAGCGDLPLSCLPATRRLWKAYRLTFPGPLLPPAAASLSLLPPAEPGRLCAWRAPGSRGSQTWSSSPSSDGCLWNDGCVPSFAQGQNFTRGHGHGPPPQSSRSHAERRALPLGRRLSADIQMEQNSRQLRRQTFGEGRGQGWGWSQAPVNGWTR